MAECNARGKPPPEKIVGYIWSAFSVPLCLVCAQSKNIVDASDEFWNPPITDEEAASYCAKGAKCDSCGVRLMAHSQEEEGK